MPQEVLQRAIDKNLTTRQIAQKAGVSQTTVNYWLRKYELKTKYRKRGIPRDPSVPRKCVLCRETDPAKFYGRRWNFCKDCDNERTKRRGQANRVYAIEKLGGVCKDCGFDVPVCLDVHHLDASTKDVAFASMRSWSRERIDAELKGCTLVCKNCHAIRHEEERAAKRTLH